MQSMADWNCLPYFLPNRLPRCQFVFHGKSSSKYERVKINDKSSIRKKGKLTLFTNPNDNLCASHFSNGLFSTIKFEMTMVRILPSGKISLKYAFHTVVEPYTRYKIQFWKMVSYRNVRLECIISIFNLVVIN